MNIENYRELFTAEHLMGPNSIRVLKELLDRYPVQAAEGDIFLDLGCGTGLTSMVIARETGAKVYANDLWVSAEDNLARFRKWGMADQLVPVCEDATKLRFDEKLFSGLFSIDSYHYFAGEKGFFQEKIMPFLKDGAVVIIGIPGLRDEFENRAEELLSPWLGEDAYMFKTPGQWREIMGSGGRIESVDVWEMDCFDCAWSDWLATENEFAVGDRAHFESIIKPYTCFVGIAVKLK